MAGINVPAFFTDTTDEEIPKVGVVNDYFRETNSKCIESI